MKDTNKRGSHGKKGADTERTRTNRLNFFKRMLCFMVVAGIVLDGIAIYFADQKVSASGELSLYAAPTGSGSECTLIAPCSLEGARDQARLLNSSMTGDIHIYLRGGTYLLEETFELGAEDSGGNGYYIHYEAYPSENPVLSGGIPITGWELHDAVDNIFKAEVPQGTDSRQLFVNGKRAVRAKGGELADAVKTATGYTTSDLSLASWGNPSNIEFVFRRLWTESRCSVASITAGVITMDEPCFTMVNNSRSVAADLPTWIENAYELLDEEGEWYLDRSTDDVYYKPRADENLATAEVIMPVLETLVRGTGTLETPITNLTFSGITFSHGTWLQPNSEIGYREIQANLISPSANPLTPHSFEDLKMPANVTFSGGKHIRFERNRFEQLGAVGLNLDGGAQNNVIEGNLFRDISGNAIMLGDVTQEDYHPSDERRVVSGNRISNNFITLIGVEYNGAVGIWTGYTQDNLISHNEITDVPYSGISVGWGWGDVDEGGYYQYPRQTIVENNKVINNKIWNAMHTMIDGAGIYSLSADRNQLISGNVIYDVHTHGAIYLDNKSRYNTVMNNVSFDITGSNHLFFNDNRGNTLLQYNFWDQSAGLYDNSKNGVFVGNQYAEDVQLLPASIISNAGLEPAYRDLNPRGIPADTESPTAPGNLKIAERIAAVTANSVELEWDAANDNELVTGYEIVRDGLVVGVTRDTFFQVLYLKPDETYLFTVRARDAAGNLSSDALPLQVVTLEDERMDNLALHKKVIVEYDSPEGREADMHVNHEADKAVDGDRTTSAAATGEYDWQLQVDLESVQEFDRIVVEMRQPELYATEYDLRISDNGVDFTTIKSVVGSQGGRQEHEFENISGRYVRVVAVKPDGPNQDGVQMHVLELEVYHSSSPANLALQKPARAFYIGGTTTVKSSGYEAIVDGNLSSFSQAAAATPWRATIDLGFRTVFNQISVIMDEVAYASAFRIETSTDGQLFELVEEVTDFTGGIYVAFSPQNARYVKISAIEPQEPLAGEQMAVYEVMVYNTSNLAIGKPAEAIDDEEAIQPMLPGHEADKSNDGNPDTYAQSASTEPWYWQVDLGHIQPLNVIRLLATSVQERPEHVGYRVWTSADGESFTEVAADVELSSVWETISLPQQQARFLRVSLELSHQADAADRAIVKEVEIYLDQTLLFQQTTTSDSESDRYVYQQVSDQPYLLQAGDVIEYEVYLHDDVAGIGGIDLRTTDGRRMKDREEWLDRWGIHVSPASDLSVQGSEMWLKRELPVPSYMQGRTVASWYIAMENDAAATTFASEYRNMVVRNAYGKVALRVQMDPNYAIALEDIQGYEVDESVKSVELDSYNLELISGDQVELTAIVKPSYAANQQVVWSTSDAQVAVVDQSGKVTARAEGNAILSVITVDGGYEAHANVKVRYKRTKSSNYALYQPALAYHPGGSVIDTHIGHSPDMGNDGDPLTYAIANGSYAWVWEVDLGEVKEISYVAGSMNPNGYATEFAILGSVDGELFTELGVIQQSTGEEFKLRFPAAEYRYVRVKALKPDGPGQPGELMMIGEVEVYNETLDDAWLLQEQAVFNRNPAYQADILVPIVWNGHELDAVKLDHLPLVEGIDYTISVEGIVVQKSYLANLTGVEAELSIVFENEANVAFTLELVDTTF